MSAGEPVPSPVGLAPGTSPRKTSESRQRVFENSGRCAIEYYVEMDDMSNKTIHEMIQEEETVCKHLIGKMQDEHKVNIMLKNILCIHRGGKCVIIRIVNNNHLDWNICTYLLAISI